MNHHELIIALLLVQGIREVFPDLKNVWIELDEDLGSFVVHTMKEPYFHVVPSKLYISYSLQQVLAGSEIPESNDADTDLSRGVIIPRPSDVRAADVSATSRNIRGVPFLESKDADALTESSLLVYFRINNCWMLPDGEVLELDKWSRSLPEGSRNLTFREMLKHYRKLHVEYLRSTLASMQTTLLEYEKQSS